MFGALQSPATIQTEGQNPGFRPFSCARWWDIQWVAHSPKEIVLHFLYHPLVLQTAPQSVDRFEHSEARSQFGCSG